MQQAADSRREIRPAQGLHLHLYSPGGAMKRRYFSASAGRVPVVLAALFGLVVLAGPAEAMVNIDVTHGNQAPLPIALPNFPGSTPQETEVGRNIMSVV